MPNQPSEFGVLVGGGIAASGGDLRRNVRNSLRRVLVQTPFEDRNAQFSPDGRWIAYESNLSGRFEICVQPFGRSGPRQQVSTTGGAQVRWARDRQELFYISLDGSLIAVPFKVAANAESIQWGIPVRLFQTKIGGAVQVPPEHHYVISADGQRFLMNTVLAEPTSPIVVILNWNAGRTSRQ